MVFTLGSSRHTYVNWIEIERLHAVTTRHLYDRVGDCIVLVFAHFPVEIEN